MPCASTPDARPSPNAGRRPACVRVLSSTFPVTAEEGPFPGSYRFRRLDFELLETNPGAQYFADTPGLSEAAARRVRWVAVEDLADRTDAGVDHGAHLCGPQWAEWQRDGKKLIGPHARIATRAAIDVDHIVQAMALRIPESIKMSAGVRQQGFTAMRCPCIAYLGGQARGDVQGVEPQRIDLDTFPHSRRDYPVAHLGIHPRQLHTGLAGA